MKIGNSYYYFFLYKSKINRKGCAPIYCRLKFNSGIKILSTGIYIPKKQWNHKKSSISSKKDLVAYSSLEKWKAKIHAYLTQSFLLGNSPDLNELLNVLGYKTDVTKPIGILEVFEHYNIKIQKQIGQNYTLATYRKFIVIYNQLQDFIKNLYSAIRI